MQLFLIRLCGWKDPEGIVFDKTSPLDKSCQGLSLVNQRWKDHHKELTSAFKQFENVTEVTEDLFLSLAYLPDELWANNAISLYFVFFHLGWTKVMVIDLKLMTTDKETLWLAGVCVNHFDLRSKQDKLD